MFGQMSNNNTNGPIKNVKPYKFENHFTWHSVSVVWFLALFCAGLIMTFAVSGQGRPGSETAVMLFSPLLVLLITLFIRRWEAVFVLLVCTSASVFYSMGTSAWIFLAFVWAGSITGPMIQMCKEWERAIVLRLGKFRRVKGPGLFVLLPFIDSVITRVDLRIRVTDFTAETTLTLDSAPITVDALCFWLVWDAEKAVCEVENYVDAVVYSSQSALRAAISGNDLSTLLSSGETIEEHMRKEVDRKTTEWGITIQHIEITQIEIPRELQEAMSHIAQAEREKEAHILLSDAEKEIAARLDAASKIYSDNAIALKLKQLAVLQEGFKNGNSMVLVPSQLPAELNDDNVFGLKALSELKKAKGTGELE
jgi:regulator of protease activity HflC (stomatin/prohibitin superfamily)